MTQASRKLSCFNLKAKPASVKVILHRLINTSYFNMSTLSNTIVIIANLVQKTTAINDV